VLCSNRTVSRPRTLTGRSGQSSVPPIAIVLLVLIAVLIGATVYLYLEINKTRTQFAEQIQVFEEQIAQLEGNVNRTSRAVDDSVQEVKGLVESAEKTIDEKAQSVEQRVSARTNTLAKDLEATKARQQEALQEVGGRITELNQVATSTKTEVGELTGRVDTVREDLTETSKTLEQTIADLKSVRGDLGVQSGLIATNSGELQALKRLGQRNYFEFDIAKDKGATKVGRIQLRLRDTNEKRNRFNIEVMADDKTIEKKNKTLLEPIQFYVMGVKQPYEIVVNKLEKNRIAGYLATPLEDSERPATAGSSE
jgi:chromosome segregation ATPase